VKYGDDYRFPLEYLETDSSHVAGYYEFPLEMKHEPFESYRAFPKVSEQILVALFANIGVELVPEITLYELAEKTPMQSFEDFCMTFGGEENMINSLLLNQIVERLEKMDKLRKKRAFNSKPIYTALSERDLKEADRLIDEMKDECNRDIALDNLNKDR
jgi:hypothetical protein